ncbi:MAG TPA: riboflavin synthase [Longimicrobiales bacterium]|nr:riboflavin synthase [Longimicrobiales bacterium]
MFTGIVTAVGVVRSVDKLVQARRLEIGAPAGYLDGVAEGDSIAVDGVCQTVVARSSDSFTVEAIGTTLSRTTLGDMDPGRRVNLELALSFGERLGGHLVQGHVDGTGRVLAIDRQDEYVLLDVSLPEDVAEVTVLHGSITIDGVSLTVNALPGPRQAQVALIPYTWDNTNLSRLVVGAAVNLEGDMLGRFVVHHLKVRSGDVSGATPD